MKNPSSNGHIASRASSEHRPATLVLIALSFTLVCLLSPAMARAQQIADFAMYSNGLVNGCWDGSWAPDNMSETTVVLPGCTEGISVDMSSTPWGGVYIGHSPFDATGYQNLTFYINGGPTGGQNLRVQAANNYNPNASFVLLSSYIPGGTLPANQWVQVTIPLTDLGTSLELSAFSGFWVQDNTGTGQPVFYMDQATIAAPPPPAEVNVSVAAGETLHSVDERIFGVNTATWDGNIDESSTVALLQAAGARAFRFPGGSTSDGYHWFQQNPNWLSEPMTPQFGSLAESLGAQAFITADYGDGTPQSNAAWVAYCNAAPTSKVAIGVDSNGVNWKTAGYWARIRAAAPLATDDGYNFLRASHPTAYGFMNWEIGNECYGGWEYDTHTPQHDPVVYANFAVQTSKLMKKVDPSVKVGVVITGSEDGYGNGETVTNPVTGQQHSGWDAVLYYTLNSLSYKPDFVIYHNYAQGPGSENDAFLLQYAAGWPGIAQSIRTSLNDYFGVTTAKPIQLCCTENNSVYTNPGKQSTSLVNGLFYADSVGALMQTEFHSLVWWDLHNGEDPGQNNSSLLYGWRLYGDYGMLSAGSSLQGAAYNTPFPTYYALKLLQYLARNGDKVVSATSSYSGLSVYAVKQQSGSLALLVINKNPVYNETADIAISGFVFSGNGTSYQYGTAQDTTQSEGQSVDIAQIAIADSPSTEALVFPAYSMTVLDLAPLLPPSPVTATASGGQVTVQWSASAGATKYNLLRSKTSGGEAAYKTGLTTISFVDKNVTAGTTYYYKVVAVGPNGLSGRSAEASATP